LWISIYCCIVGYGEKLWSLVQMDLFKEICAWHDEYATILGGFNRVEELKNSLLLERSTTVSIFIFNLII